MLEIVYHKDTKKERYKERKKDTKSKADYSQTPFYRTGSAKIEKSVLSFKDIFNYKLSEIQLKPKNAN